MMKKPNLLFVFSDQHRQQSLGLKNPQIISPEFDKFAKKAAAFNNCVSNSPVCVPMRGSILTGQYAWNHRAITNDLPVKTDIPGIADALNNSGWHTGYIGKWHLGGVPRNKPIPEGERLGFTEWKVANCNHDYANGYCYDEKDEFHKFDKFESIAQTDLALDFIRRNSQNDEPWALFLSWGPPHAPFDAVPKKYLDMYDPDKIELPPNVPKNGRYMVSQSKHLNEKELREWFQGYYALITLLDGQFGRLVNEIESSGLLEDTIIVYTSDHGDMLGSQSDTKKQRPHNESALVPLMVSWEGRTANMESDEIIGLTDLPVSIAGLMGVNFEAETDGADMHELFTDKAAKGRDAALIYDLVPCHQSYDRGGMEWMGFYGKDYTYAIDSKWSDYVLYDNRDDKHQLNNLAGTNPGLSAKLKERLKSMLEDCGYDFRPWQKMIVEDGYKELWNESQRHFNREELQDEIR